MKQDLKTKPLLEVWLKLVHANLVATRDLLDAVYSAKADSKQTAELREVLQQAQLALANLVANACQQSEPLDRLAELLDECGQSVLSCLLPTVEAVLSESDRAALYLSVEWRYANLMGNDCQSDVEAPWKESAVQLVEEAQIVLSSFRGQ